MFDAAGRLIHEGVILVRPEAGIGGASVMSLRTRAVWQTIIAAFAYLGLAALALAISVGSWTPSFTAAWELLAQERRDALARNIAALPVAFTVAVVVCVLVRLMIRETGVPWHLSVSGAIAASCGPVTFWLGFVVDEVQVEGWARAVPMWMVLGSALFVGVGLIWMFVRRVIAVEAVPSVSSGVEEGALAAMVKSCGVADAVGNRRSLND
ncbi:hypothetical protein [Microbacterium galbinum]|uniref:Uncharacterized protein n=1 Tax=Microbacterium galbinum TaxID=2851646 RepID=A0ABY4ISY5_9MICO|nr:hypothetical protein [Microbacterium galbinum]MCK2029459.1 hypothetical protein [Microbacterium galbinum]UPL14765.1 hypothetical protein KV396_09860 [Microbacterium galbinum]